ncbi:hypothetical protein LOZ12_006743 [Ophidiomyces ophidiicola]|uniref:Uncharacterized protein n=1 Tax=Ophidiomyces ophidiicola TaxID=1387563 RepID=A0ACB8UM49_9EURO|nr:hypothetical protein LOZ64_006846 [Ophidiomyces ophidiicola]KAI1931875.1 hypothetical protein LOZ62_006766 [Ophidiomyces ophidiicola]KAI1946615.1 hypothetical protein LOZ59_006795 [Ophidiomyces ophidiicola]KAI1961645.1 hypothetical protein LOZ56_006716 [Ophidiomyces ophidiicola]KAI1998827.1 hypothetical protein LOZ50_006814 [Ophidiomyces ophidiicola]
MFSTESKEKASYIEYRWINGVETLERYRPGGYHPVVIGNVLHGRYRIVDKLGFGGYSTLWLARDIQLCRYVVVKVGVADSRPHETRILRQLSAQDPPSSSTSTTVKSSKGRDLIPVLLDEFKIKGPNGIHPCYTMTPAQCNLREASYSRLFPIDVARGISAALALAVVFLHGRGYIHGDIHLRNVLARLPSSFDELSVDQFYEKYGKPETVPISRCDGGPLPPNIPAEAVLPLSLEKAAWDFTLADAQVLLSDFGEAFTSAEVRYGEECHTPLSMRAPEARFEPRKPLTFAADIWSLGVAIWEVIGMKAIFSGECSTADEIISQQVDVLGPMPSEWWEKWDERDQFFDSNRCPKEGRYVWPAMEEAFQEGVQKYRQQKPHMGVFGTDEKAAVLDLIRRMLVFKPEKRLTIEEVLETEWMVKWALPAFERAKLASATRTCPT